MRITLSSPGLYVGILGFLGSSLAHSVNQNTAYKQTDVTNRQGSDVSLQDSTAYAMTALMDLNNLNISSAVNNGITAYGKYRNSEKMDKLGDKNAALANSLGSIGSTAPAPRPATNTTFRRLDPKFLSQGKYKEVAENFEKRSGMRREVFLQQIGEVSEKKLSRKDPELMNKLMGRFESFINKIPNPSFRGNLQKAVNMVPTSVRSGIVSKAITQFTGALAVSGKTLSTPAAGSVRSVASVAPAAAPSPILAETAVAAAAGTTTSPSEAGSADTEELGNVVQSALNTQAEDLSLFQQVSRRYRALAPHLQIP